MDIRRYCSFEQLESAETRWNGLAAGNPFRSYEWLHSWWLQYAPCGQLYLVAAFEQGELVGLVPLYAHHHAAGERTLRLLGSGQVCTDHLTVLADPEHEAAVIASVVEWLSIASQQNGPDRWDWIEFENVLEEDPALRSLRNGLAATGCEADIRQATDLWHFQLPDSWDTYLAAQSKGRRKRLRRYDRTIDQQGFTFRVLEDPNQLEGDLETFFDLHQRRRGDLGQQTALVAPQFEQFIRTAAPRLLAAGRLQLAFLERGPEPLAVEFSLLGDSTVHMYQSGMDPTADAVSPGNLITMWVIQRAIEEGRPTIDFMRGNEPYKATWGGQPRRAVTVRIAADRWGPRIRQSLWSAGRTVKDILRDSVNGMREEVSP